MSATNVLVEETQTDFKKSKHTFSSERRFQEMRVSKVELSVQLMQKRTGIELGPGKYEPADRVQTISSTVNQSHHVTSIPIMGLPYPKETTI